jgi:hypothetical protein
MLRTARSERRAGTVPVHCGTAVAVFGCRDGIEYSQQKKKRQGETHDEPWVLEVEDDKRKQELRR